MRQRIAPFVQILALLQHNGPLTVRQLYADQQGGLPKTNHKPRWHRTIVGMARDGLVRKVSTGSGTRAATWEVTVRGKARLTEEVANSRAMIAWLETYAETSQDSEPRMLS